MFSRSGTRRRRAGTLTPLFDALDMFLAPLEVLPFDEAATRQYGKLRSHLEAKGTPIGALDLLIAAHALALGAVVVTDSEREFRRVPALVVENWVE